MSYAGNNIKAQIVLHLAKGPMTIDRLAAVTRRGKSAVEDHLVELKKVGLVCIVSWQKTGGNPIRVWGIGKTNAEKPAPMSREEKLRRRREAARAARAAQHSDKPATPVTVIPRRDPAAAWF